MRVHSMLLALLLLVSCAAPLAAQDKGPVFTRKYFIGAEAAVVWDAIVNPKVVKEYHMAPLGGIELKTDGEIWYGTADKKAITGKVVEVVEKQKLVHTFQFAHRKDQPSRVTYEIEPLEDMCALKLTHDQFPSENETWADINGGWDAILSNLKTLLETGDVLPWPTGDKPREEANLNKAQIIELPSEDELPGTFEIFKVDLSGVGDHGWGSRVERGEVAVQKGHALSFTCPDTLTGPQFAKLKDVPRLARLYIGYVSELNDRGLRALGLMVDLRELNVSGLKITDKGLRGLSGLKNLEGVTLSSCPALKGTCLRALPAPEKLRRVSLSWIDISDESLASLEKCTRLRHLSVTEGGKVTDAGLAFLKSMVELEQLSLPTYCQITDAGLKHLVGMAALASLQMSGLEGVTGACFESLGKLANLKSLDVYSCANLTSPGPDALANLKLLERVAFNSCVKLDDGLAAALARCPMLQQITLQEVSVTDKGIADLSAMSKLQTLYLSKLEIGDDSCKSIAKLGALNALSLDYCQRITNAGVKELAVMKGLRELSLRGSETLTDDCLAHFEAFPALTSLTLYYCKRITKEGVEKLRAAKPKLWVSFD